MVEVNPRVISLQEILKEDSPYRQLCRRCEFVRGSSYLELKYLGVVPAFLGSSIACEEAAYYRKLVVAGCQPCGIVEQMRNFWVLKKEYFEEVLQSDIRDGFVIPENWRQVLFNLMDSFSSLSQENERDWFWRLRRESLIVVTGEVGRIILQNRRI